MSKSRRKVLEEIYAKHGYLNKQLVLAESTPVDADLHDQFEWDDMVGGHVNRLHQAGQIIRSVKVVYKEPKGDQPPGMTRAWVSYTPPESKPVYLPAAEALADPFTRELTLRNAKREWLALKRKYGHMEEFAAIVSSEEEEQAG